MKTTNGGSLLPGDYQKYADYLCSYVTTLKSQTGIDLYALSIQNEPDYVAQWDMRRIGAVPLVEDASPEKRKSKSLEVSSRGDAEIGTAEAFLLSRQDIELAS
jgi:hypothetical protein